MQIFPTMRRLHERGRDCRGLVVDEAGVMLGPDCVLVRRTPAGYCAADDRHVTVLVRFAFGNRTFERLPTQLDA